VCALTLRERADWPSERLHSHATGELRASLLVSFADVPSGAKFDGATARPSAGRSAAFPVLDFPLAQRLWRC
jgi:hypothetical protein